jgi:hypothetical protein
LSKEGEDLKLWKDFDYVGEDIVVNGVAPVAVFVSISDAAKSLALNEYVRADRGEPGGQLFWRLIRRRLLLGAHFPVRRKCA